MTIKKLLYALVLPLLLFTAQVQAQEKTVTGRVTDASGAPVANASITLVGGTTGTQTGSDGTFTIKVPSPSSRLSISSVGFSSQEVAVGSGVLNISLGSSTAALSEVVVIGYGSVKKKDLTGSVSVISSKDFQKGNITTPEQMIAGKAAGVQITSNGGRPGAGSTIRIRGGSSINAGNDPLIVIDGIPLDQGGISGAANPLSFINSNDIESFTILKDASAAAIYGTRAANGVLLITTKKGKSGAFKVTFNTNNAVSYNTKQVDVLTGDQVREIVNSLGSDKNKSQLGTANTNWQKEIYQAAIASDNNITLSGGIKKFPYRITLGYLNQSGILKTDRLQRTSLSLAINPTFFDNHLKVDINLKGSMQETRFAAEGAIGTAVGFDPTQPVFSNDKRFGGYQEWRESDGSLVLNRPNNPVGLLYQTSDKQSPKRSLGNIVLDYKFHFLPELRANLNLGYDVSKNTGTKFISDSAASNYLTGGLTQNGKQTKQNTLLDFYLNYSKDIAAINSRIDITGGYSYNNFQTKNYSFRDLNAKGDTIANTKPPTFPFDIPENTLLSYFGRMNYTLNDRYLFTATVRRDGSSKFSKENRWGTFPSFALAWNIKKESFLKNSSVFSDLKLRLGYGVTGQQNGIGNYDYLARYGLGGLAASYPFGNVFYQTYGPFGYNANLKWESTSTYNAAIDYSFANGRINGSVDVYLKKTKDLLNSVPQPTGTNFSAFVLANIGSMENKGVEFNLNLIPVKSKNLNWDINFNATYNKNTITNLTVIPNDPTYIGVQTGGASGVNGFLQLHSVGGPRNTFNLYHQIYDANGKPIEGLFEDMNRDGQINEKDRYKGHSAIPNVLLGFSTNVYYKNWNFGVVLRSNFNNFVYNNVYSSKGLLNQIAGNYTTGNASSNYLETRFTGAKADVQPFSDYYLSNASFLRMDNLNIGYDFGKINHKRFGLRTTVSVQNVFVITKYKGLDPELEGGIDNNIYPRPRIISLGFNLDF